MLKKYSISIKGHQTSYSLEKEFFTELKEIASSRKTSLASLITEIDEAREPGQNLSSSLRLFVLREIKARTTKQN